MNKIYPVTKENLPFSDEKFQDILQKIQDQHEEELDKLEEDIEICKEHIFHNRTDEKELGGFSIAICFKKIDNKIFCNIEQIIIYDDEDEWLAEYKRIKEMNNND